MSDAPDPTPTVEPPLQRTISPVSGRLEPPRLSGVLILAGAILGCGVLLMANWPIGQHGASHAVDQPARQVVAFEPATPSPTLTAPGADAPSLTGPAATEVPALQPQPQPASSNPNPPSAPLLAFRQGSSRDATPLAPAAEPAQPQPTELEGLRQGSVIGLARATRLPNRNLLILAGATIPCVVQTAMSSATPGYVSCLVTRDVLSDSGRVVLLEKGARVMGEYRANLRQGQRRLFVLWTRAVTPTGVAVPLASPAADALGRAGFDGEIDTHFWDRFGAGLLLSIIDSGGHDLEGQNISSATARLPSDAAGVALQSAANIPPTLTKPQGGEISIFVAQDLDFSRVYDLSER